jgi:hypothetical protein
VVLLAVPASYSVPPLDTVAPVAASASPPTGLPFTVTETTGMMNLSNDRSRTRR